MTFTLRKRHDRIQGRIARLRKVYGRDKSTWPPEAINRFEQLKDRAVKVREMMGGGR